jgi:hypothetical protein
MDALRFFDLGLAAVIGLDLGAVAVVLDNFLDLDRDVSAEEIAEINWSGPGSPAARLLFVNASLTWSLSASGGVTALAFSSLRIGV